MWLDDKRRRVLLIVGAALLVVSLVAVFLVPWGIRSIVWLPVCVGCGMVFFTILGDKLFRKSVKWFVIAVLVAVLALVQSVRASYKALMDIPYVASPAMVMLTDLHPSAVTDSTRLGDPHLYYLQGISESGRDMTLSLDAKQYNTCVGAMSRSYKSDDKEERYRQQWAANHPRPQHDYNPVGARVDYLPNTMHVVNLKCYTIGVDDPYVG